MTTNVTGTIPVIAIDRQEVRNRSGPGGGPELAKVLVGNDEGLHAIFWISVVFKNGRPVLVVSTEPSDKQRVTKTVMGTCNRV